MLFRLVLQMASHFRQSARNSLVGPCGTGHSVDMDQQRRITDKDSLEAWLKTRPRSDAFVIAHRAAMRAFPLWFMMEAPESPEVALRPARLNLLSMVSFRFTKDTDVRRIALSQSETHDSWPTPNIYIEGGAAQRGGFVVSPSQALDAAKHAFSPDYVDAVMAVQSAAWAAGASLAGGADEIWSEAELDRRAVLAHGVEDYSTMAFNTPLWTAATPIEPQHRIGLQVVQTLPGGEFWSDWYQRALDGRLQDWELLRNVALIDEELWSGSGAELDEEINRLFECSRLLDETRSLKEQLAAIMRKDEAGTAVIDVDFAPVGFGHNSGLGYLKDITPAASHILDSLKDAEAELLLKTPSPAKLRRIGQAIKKAGQSVANYCAQLGHKFLDSIASEAGKSVGKWVGPGLFLYLAENSERIRKLGEAIANLADKF